MSEPIVRMQASIRGHVQGVGFRWFAEREAHRAGISGYVRNLPDGSVEVVAEGPKGALETFVTLLRRGPAGAAVHDLGAEWGMATGLNGFRIRG